MTMIRNKVVTYPANPSIREHGLAQFDALTVDGLGFNYEHQYFYSASALAIGDLVHISGYDATSGLLAVEKADADDATKSAQYIAITTNAGTAVSGFADVYELTGLNTNSASAVGSPVYLDNTTAGGWTLTAPATTGMLDQIVGRVTVKSATVGKILFFLRRFDATIHA
jgi:hypothetical protein